MFATDNLSGDSFLEFGLQIAIKLLCNQIDLVIAKLAKSRGKSVIFKGDASLAVLAQKHANGCIAAGRD
jgi:hypothetical protein